ncbi:unnamed protein product [Phytomonas sp. EM1]|nr:unnamed protein product [Phytomonas sp. EM1]|eukprot:CCW64312.1 unnamed protein product [Phytomonas sp. isolate EM1]
MPRQPTKNRIAMHDVIGQPLTALPDTVDAILRRPEPLDEVEVQGIFHESSYILLRAEEALSVKDGQAFCALFKLFSEGFAHSDALFEEGIKTFVLHGALLETVHSIFRVVVEQRRLPLHSSGTTELIQVVSSLCDSEALKDKCGDLFMSDLAHLLARVYEDKDEAKRHFHVQRAVTTALINLVKGSKQNKLRLGSWKFVANCCMASVDVFFQLQCAELLFRVSRQRRSVLMELEDSLPQDILKKLSALPNDSTLLRRMIDLIQDLNSGNPEVLQFFLKQVDAADSMLTESTEAYFTPHYFTVMVTSSNADNITIPYKFIRSVTLGKDGRIIIKLEDFPVKLEALLSHTPGMDTVTLHLTVDRLRAFKQSAIRGWIVSELTVKKSNTSQQSEQPPAQTIPLTSVNHHSCHSISGSKRQTLDISRERADDRQPDLLTDVAILELPSVSHGDTLHKKARFEPLANLKTPGSFDLEKPILDMIDNISESASSEEARAIFAQLNRLIEAKMEVSHGEALSLLNKQMSFIQTKVDIARRRASESRNTWQQNMAAGVEKLEQFINDTQNMAVDGVFKLNEDLRQVKQSNQALNERIVFIEFELQRTLEESRAVELTEVHELQDMCKRDIEHQEFELDQQMINKQSSAISLMSYFHEPPLCDSA